LPDPFNTESTDYITCILDLTVRFSSLGSATAFNLDTEYIVTQFKLRTGNPGFPSILGYGVFQVR